MGRNSAAGRGCRIAAGGLPALIGLLLLWPDDSWLSRVSYDLLLSARGRVTVTDAVLVQLDEESRARSGLAVNEPWRRRELAQLVDRLTTAKAAAVVFDLVLRENRWSGTHDDHLLAAAIGRNGRVVLAAGAFPVPGQTDRDPVFDLPGLAFRREAARRFGHNGLAASGDDVVRRHPSSYAEANTNKLSLSWRVASLLQAPVTQPTNLTDWIRAAALTERGVNYYGPAGHVPSTPLFAALNTNLTSDDFFRDRVVFVGVPPATQYFGEQSSARGSPFRRPWSAWREPVSGTELQATLALNLVRGDWLRRLPRAVELSLFPLLGAVAGLVCLCLRVRWAALVTGLLGLLTVASAWGMFWQGNLWIPWLVPLVEFAVGAGFALAVRTRGQAGAAGSVPDWSRHFSPAAQPRLAAVLARQPDHLAPKQREVTVLFSEPADFAEATAQTEPKTLADALGGYFRRALDEAVFPEAGTFIRFAGEGLVALWNAPEVQADAAVRACRAALRLGEAGRVCLPDKVLGPRVAVHTGEALVGNFGGAARGEYGAFGGEVRLAARLNGLNRCLGTAIVISAATHQRIGRQLVTRYLGRFVLKGIATPVETHELVGEPVANPELAELHAAFATALTAFQAGDQMAALNGFQQVATRWPNDGPTQFYLRTLVEIISHSAANAPAGTVELDEEQ